MSQPEIVIGPDRWERIPQDDAIRLGALHFAEVNDGMEPRRRFDLDVELLSLCDQSRALRIISARRGGELVGYFTWTIQPDVESRGLLSAEQGAWFLAPDAGWSIAHRMWAASLAELRALGVKMVWPHHHLQGRGAHLGRFFERHGAKPHKIVYGLWIGGD